MDEFLLNLGVLDDGDIDLNLVLGVVGILAQPLEVVNNDVIERREIHRNEHYYEETIQRYDDISFREHFRMSRETFELITGFIAIARPNLQNVTIPLEKKVLFTIWILSKQESFLACGDRFGMARSTAYDAFKDIVSATIDILPLHVVWPNNGDASVEVFQERGFPSVRGAIDGCHIRIKQPHDNAHDYYNRNKYHSIILQGVVDHKLKFVDVFVGMPGRMHDARVFRNSNIYMRITDEADPLLPNHQHILGDSAYPLMMNVMTPFRDNGHLTDEQINFNTRLSSVRSIVERAFGRLKGKFRRLRDLDVGTAEVGSNIIAASCVLHNINIDNDNYEEEYENEDDDMPEMVEDEVNDREREQEHRAAAAAKRIQIMNNL